MIPTILAAAVVVSAMCVHGSSSPHGEPGQPARPFVHSVADVSDPLSHGVVGDGLLSVNEAIQLHNRTLLTSQLSLAEQAQLSGAGADISWINIDASWTPTITVERDFDVIVDLPHGCLIQAFNGEAEFDFRGAGVLHGFRAQSNFCNWRNLILTGGRYGIDLQQTDASFGGTVVDNVRFDGQSQWAFAVSGLTANGYGRVLFDRCRFSNTPTAIRCDESGPLRTTVLVAFNTEIAGVATGMDVVLGSGGAALLQLDRVVVSATGTAIDVRRSIGGDRPLSLAITHLRANAAQCLRLQGSPTGASVLDLHMLDLAAVSGGVALDLGPVGSSIAGVIEDSTLSGAVSVAAGQGTAPLAIHNVRLTSGTVVLGSSGAPVTVTASRFDGCAVTTLGTAPVTISDSCLVGGSLQGTIGAVLHLNSTFQGAAVGPNVASVAPMAAAQLGSMNLTPQVATTGGQVTLGADLPAGFFGVFVIGPTLELPIYASPDLHVYLDLGCAITLPGLVVGQQGTAVPIPNDPAFWDTDWVAQLAVLAAIGVSGPALQVPPGRRFTIRQ